MTGPFAPGPADAPALTIPPDLAEPIPRRGRGPWGRWRRSLQARVVATTLVVSVFVVVLMGVVVSTEVRNGVLRTKQRAAVDQAATGLASVQRDMNQLTGSDPEKVQQLLREDLGSLNSQTSRAGQSSLLLFPSVGQDPRLGYAVGDVDESTITADLRRAVAHSSQLFSQYVSIREGDEGKPTPALVVGGALTTPGGVVGESFPYYYEIYWVFPLDQEVSTLALVRQTLLFAGFGLVLLLVVIAVLVTRQVVRPVRQAARTAESLATGGLDQRMAVHSTDELATLAHSFNRMAESLQKQIGELEALSRVQRRFVSDVSHELRTPLTTVQMAADVLFSARRDFPAPVARSAELLQHELDRFESLLVDLLEISRHDAGAVELEVDSVDLRTLVTGVVEASRGLAQASGSALVVALPDEPVLAEVDPRRVQRILRNLVSNALEHGEGQPVRIELAGNAAAVAIAVLDQGVGLRPEESTLVFNRFWRADPSRARRSGGTGLGLAIALEDAHLHGGWLQAWGEPGQGATFRLTLPRRTGVPIDESPLGLGPMSGAPVDEAGEVVRG